MSVHFTTPVRIYEDGRTRTDLDFRVLVKAALSRVSSLALFHCSATMRGDPKAALDLAAQVGTTFRKTAWIPLKRWSNRQKQQLPLDGLVGQIGFDSAAVQAFWPLLKAAELTHIGKGTVFGLGKYVLREGHSEIALDSGGLNERA